MSNGEGVLLPELPEPYEMLPDSLMPVADEWYKQICERAGYVDRLTISGDLVSAIKAAIGEPRYTADQLRAYGEQCRAQGWIPVGERLPGEDEHVLAYWDGVQECALGYYDSVAGWISVEHGERFDNSPTHWMPLPATPTPGGTP